MRRGGPLERRTPLKPGKPLDRGSSTLKRTPLERGKPLDRGGGLSRGGPLNQRSPKRSHHMAEERRPLVESLVEAGVTCEISPVLEELGISHRCAGVIGGMHERRKSGAGGSRTNLANLVPACNWCNGFLEDMIDPERSLVEATALVVREGDPEWELLSKRRDREALANQGDDC